MNENDGLSTYTARVAAIDLDTPFVDVVNTIGLIKEAKRRLGEIQKEAEQHAVTFIQANGDQQIHETRYYAGPDRDWKCNDVPRTFDALLEAKGGDLYAVVQECLSSGALKPGACKAVLEGAKMGDRFGQLFTMTERWEIKEGKPKTPKLQAVNQNFIR